MLVENGGIQAKQAGLAHLVIARLLAGAVPLQILMPFLGVPLAVHRFFGAVLGLLVLFLVVLANLAPLGRDTRRIGAVLLVLFLVQPATILLADHTAVMSTLHGLNGVVIFGVTLVQALESETGRV